MKKLLSKISLALFLGTMVSGTSGIRPANYQLFSADAQNTVYICVSKGATRYHLNKDCHGLQRCKSEIESTTAKKAQGKGLTLCKFED